MRNQFIWKQQVQEEKEHLKDYEIFESADYMELLRSITSEITGGTLKEVQLVKEPDAPMVENVPVCGYSSILQMK